MDYKRDEKQKLTESGLGREMDLMKRWTVRNTDLDCGSIISVDFGFRHRRQGAGSV